MDKIVHFEIPFDDVDRVNKFYQEVFGWHTIPMPEMSYTVVHTGSTDDQSGMVREKGFINGGMFARHDKRKNPVLIIEVESIEDSAKRLTDHGGQMIEDKMRVGDMGYAAYFTDSEGNVLGLWENIKK